MIKTLVQNVVVAVNASQASLWACQYAVMMSKLYGSRVKAVYVVDTATLKKLTVSRLFVAEEFSRYEQNLSADGNRYLNYAAELGRQKKVDVETELRSGAVWTEIIAAANDMPANLILLGGYTGDRVTPQTAPRSAPSSVRQSADLPLQEIIAHAPCSVLIVREKMVEQLFKIV